MKEYVLVEFLAKGEDRQVLIEKIQSLGDEFQPAKTDEEFEAEDHMVIGQWYRITGRITSECASFIKLQDPFLAERMRISYIPENLKDKYRKK